MHKTLIVISDYPFVSSGQQVFIFSAILNFPKDQAGKQNKNKTTFKIHSWKK